MKQHLTIKGPLDHEEVRSWLQRPIARLEKRLTHFPPDAVHLRILVREVEGHPRSEASLTLHLPSHTLACSEEAADAHAALNAAFDELMRLVEKEKARLRREQTWRRSAEEFQRELFERMLRESGGQITPEHAERVIPKIGAVEHFVRRELRSLERNGDIARGEVDARDVVDTAVANVLAQEPGVPSRRRLMRAAAAALRAEVQRVRRARTEIRLERDIPEVPPEEEVSTLGSEIFDFYQPDEDMSMEDVIGAIGDTPEELVASAESAAAVREALSAIPTPWRMAFRLRNSEGLDDLEIAQAIEVAKDEVPRILERTADVLRAHLDERGLLRRADSGDGA